MRNSLRSSLIAIVAALAIMAGAPPTLAQQPSVDDILSAVVKIKTFINPDGRTIGNLGHRREGSGIVIDDKGHVLTIGYLMVEAHTAEITDINGHIVTAIVAGYDHDSGFGLLRATAPLKVRAMPFGKSSELKEREPVLAASFGGASGVAPAHIVAKREFTASWEYQLDEALFTAPAHSDWSGAALINRAGRLVGVGSLIVNDATGKNDGVAGNMYVPIDRLAPILATLIENGRVTGPGRPWLGLSTEELRGRLFVNRVVPDGPADRAGIKRGDIIVGIDGAAPASLADFYRKVWARGTAGVTVPLDVLQGSDRKRIEIKSMNRHDHLRLKSTF